MGHSIRHVTVLIISFLCIAVSWSCAAAADNGALEGRFRVALEARGEEYLRVRNELVALGEAVLPELRAKCVVGSWEQALLAQTVIERIDLERDIDLALGLAIEEGLVCFAVGREGRQGADSTAVALAAAFAKCPMVLAEYLWKENELRLVHSRAQEGFYPLQYHPGGIRYVAEALGLLGDVRTAGAVLYMLRTVRDDDWAAYAAAGALGEVGSVELLPELLEIVENGCDAMSRKAALAAAASLADGTCIPVIRETADRLLGRGDRDNMSLSESLEWAIAQLDLIGECGGVEMVPRLLQIVQDAADATDRRAALNVTLSLADRGSVPLLRDVASKLRNRGDEESLSLSGSLELAIPKLELRGGYTRRGKLGREGIETAAEELDKGWEGIKRGRIDARELARKTALSVVDLPGAKLVHCGGRALLRPEARDAAESVWLVASQHVEVEGVEVSAELSVVKEEDDGFREFLKDSLEARKMREGLWGSDRWIGSKCWSEPDEDNGAKVACCIGGVLLWVEGNNLPTMGADGSGDPEKARLREVSLKVCEVTFRKAGVALGWTERTMDLTKVHQKRGE